MRLQLSFIHTGNGFYRQGLVCFGAGTGICKVATSGVAPAEATAGYLNKNVTLNGTSTAYVVTEAEHIGDKATGRYKPVIASEIHVTSGVIPPHT